MLNAERTCISRSAEQTEAFGRALADRLQPGDVVALCGDLGAGKTALTRGIARGLGIGGAVTSPTYTIVNEYAGGRMPLFHFDLYRLSGAEDLFDIGWEDYLSRGGVCVVEWSERAEGALEENLTVRLTRLDDNMREIIVMGEERFADTGL